MIDSEKKTTGRLVSDIIMDIFQTERPMTHTHTHKKKKILSKGNAGYVVTD